MIYGDKFILKFFRRKQIGENPDCEIGEYLTEKAHFSGVPPFGGSIEYSGATASEISTVAMLQGLVANEGDGWTWTLEELERYYETSAAASFPEEAPGSSRDAMDLSEQPPSKAAREHIGMYLESAAALGRKTAELHRALAAATDDPPFSPEPLTHVDLANITAELQTHATAIFDLLKERLSQLPDESIEAAAAVLGRRRAILNAFANLEMGDLHAQKIRVHGDYHLGQVLRVKTDFVILDFEGEPARSLEYRRSKRSPLVDVAGMLRSFSYAAFASLINYSSRRPEDVSRLEPWAQLWERSVAAEFLRAYREATHGAEFVPWEKPQFRKLLDVFLLDKALYEVFYELNNRPAWVRIPLLGILALPL